MLSITVEKMHYWCWYYTRYSVNKKQQKQQLDFEEYHWMRMIPCDVNSNVAL